MPRPRRGVGSAPAAGDPLPKRAPPHPCASSWPLLTRLSVSCARDDGSACRVRSRTTESTSGLQQQLAAARAPDRSWKHRTQSHRTPASHGARSTASTTRASKQFFFLSSRGSDRAHACKGRGSGTPTCTERGESRATCVNAADSDIGEPWCESGVLLAAFSAPSTRS